MTWLADFHEQTDLNKYPVALRTRGGIGYQTPDGIVSNFVGHPVHYYDNGWKPITLAHSNGRFEGTEFGWDGNAVTYKKTPLFKPESVTFNGIIRPLNFLLDGQRLVSDVAGIGIYEILFTESGVKELLTIPNPLDGLLTFQVAHHGKPDELYKRERRIVSEQLKKQSGDEYVITRDMVYPIVIDPDYASHTGDGLITGYNATTYATARSTSTSFDITGTVMRIKQQSDVGFYIERSFLKLDTSGIPDSDSISQVVLKLTCTAKAVATDFDIQVVKQNWSAQDPITAANREAAYDNCLSGTLDDNIWKNTSAVVATNQYSSGNLNTAWVAKTGYTYYSLISSRDRAGIAPSANETLTIATQEHATSAYRPILTVTHEATTSNRFFYLFK